MKNQYKQIIREAIMQVVNDDMEKQAEKKGEHIGYMRSKYKRMAQGMNRQTLEKATEAEASEFCDYLDMNPSVSQAYEQGLLKGVNKFLAEIGEKEVECPDDDWEQFELFGEKGKQTVNINGYELNQKEFRYILQMMKNKMDKDKTKERG